MAHGVCLLRSIPCQMDGILSTWMMYNEVGTLRVPTSLLPDPFPIPPTGTENLASHSPRKVAAMDLYTFQKIGLKYLDTFRRVEG